MFHSANFNMALIINKTSKVGIYVNSKTILIIRTIQINRNRAYFINCFQKSW
ncbi:hypothetical protein ADICYQ_5368 [Cyclobacterium qasimii M12-11B]|uniref:Uncharacterized protein n=1 Tax=Cyclobacterium qasimii M12-11B TaxID=641524 RepID=S7V6W1_9BACT|nr:hypothetical protein ADICYQ_5368 [Cyclobacterium qasimii M12-11B]